MSKLFEKDYFLPCYFPGCSSRAVTFHHITYGQWNPLTCPLCFQHHAEITAINGGVFPVPKSGSFHARLSLFVEWIHGNIVPHPKAVEHAIKFLTDAERFASRQKKQ